MGEVRALGVCVVGEDDSGSRSYVRKNFVLMLGQPRGESKNVARYIYILLYSYEI